MKIHALVTASLLATVSPLTFADAGDTAKAHFAAIAAGQPAAIMQDYAASAVFQWVGGPLDGSYSGQDAINGVWSKFTGANGEMKVEISRLEVSANPKGETVTANVVYQGKNTIKVRYALTYRDGKIVNEVWQIDPKLMTAYQ